MRRVLTVCFFGMAAPVGLVSAAHAAEGSTASDEVERIFAESLPGNRAEPQSAAPPAQSEIRAPAGSISEGSFSAPREAPSRPAPQTRVPVAAPPVVQARFAPPAPASVVQTRQARRAPFAPAPQPARAVASSGPVRQVSSTAYCLTGRMASGKSTYSGAAAMNGVPLGSRYRVLSGPRAGSTFVVEDRIGHGSGFDIAYPGNCRAARQYGRRTISIRQA